MRRSRTHTRIADRVPGPLARFGRRHLRIVSLALIALVLVAASALQSTSTELLRQTLDANWRGDYDILVTAAGASPLVEGADTLLPSAALTDARLGTIPTRQVSEVQGLSGVDVAAPIGEVSTPTTDISKVTLMIPLDGSVDGPRAYRANTRLVIDDGVTPARTVERSLDFVVDQSAWTGFQQLDQTDDTRPVRIATSDGDISFGEETDVDRNVAWTFGGYSSPVQPPPGQGVVVVSLPVEAVQTAHLVLVDPEAEKKLLGEAGDVMDPLIATSGLIGRMGDTFFDPADPPVEGDDLTTLFEKGIATQPTPVLTRTVETPTSALSVTVAPLEAPDSVVDEVLPRIVLGETDVSGVDLSAVSAAPAGAAQEVYSGSPGDALSPLSFSSVDIPWPGFTMPELPSYAQYPLFRFAGSPILSSIDPEAASVERPTVATGADGEPQVDLRAAAVVDGELQFTSLSPITSVTDAGLAPYETNTWPVGSFTPAELHRGAPGLGQLGLGYDAADPTIVRGGTDSAAGEGLPPSWSGLGLNVAGALAVADLDNAQYLDIRDPVSSIRVRVAGIDGYTPEAQARILDVAERIRELGLTATVVAGSSFESVPVTLLPPAGLASDGTAADAGAAAPGAGAPVVSLDYSRLGAAAQAQGGVTGTNLALLVMAMVAGTALLVVVQLSSIPARRTDSTVLRQIGWPRSRIRRWLLAEEAIPLVLLAVVGAVTVAVSAVVEVTWPLVLVAVLASLGTSLVLVQRGATPPRTPRPGRVAARPGRLRSADRLGLRQAAVNRATTVILSLAFALVGIASATAVAVVLTGRVAAGSSRLGAFATAEALVPQGTLITVTLVSSAVLIVVVRRLGLERRAAQLDALRAMGWQHQHLRRAAIAEVLTSAVPGLVLGLAVTAVGGWLLAPDAVLPALLAAAVATVVVTAAVIRSSLRGGGFHLLPNLLTNTRT